jgi:hypothetical protein
MDWKRGSSNRAPALQGQSPELKPQSQQKKKKKKAIIWDVDVKSGHDGK